MWKLLDQVENPPVRLRNDDECYYARDYASGKGFSYSEANSLISNIKKPMSLKGTSQWYYKQRAISKFATELELLLGQVGESFHIAPVPTSKKLDDPDYDARLDLVLQEFASLCPNANVCSPIVRTKTVMPAHLLGACRPDVDEVCSSLGWVGLSTPPQLLFFVDDVITTGTTFVACKKMALENQSDLEVIGVFWARTTWPDSLPAVDLSALK